jgi:hypothetical protein
MSWQDVSLNSGSHEEAEQRADAIRDMGYKARVCESLEELAVPEFSPVYDHDTMRPERIRGYACHEDDTPTVISE